MEPDTQRVIRIESNAESSPIVLMARPLMLAAALTLAIMTVGCFSSQFTPPDRKGAAGEPQSLDPFDFSSAALGHWLISPSSCTAGDRELFLGADLFDDSAAVVIRLVVDPLDGPAVRVFAKAAPFENSVIFRRSECRVFHFSLESTGWRINEVQDYRLSLDLDCASKNGDTIKGRVSVNHCH
jgi:hypothetical protein